jgi:hypothetical protein
MRFGLNDKLTFIAGTLLAWCPLSVEIRLGKRDFDLQPTARRSIADLMVPAAGVLLD